MDGSELNVSRAKSALLGIAIGPISAVVFFGLLVLGFFVISIPFFVIGRDVPVEPFIDVSLLLSCLSAPAFALGTYVIYSSTRLSARRPLAMLGLFGIPLFFAGLATAIYGVANSRPAPPIDTSFLDRENATATVMSSVPTQTPTPRPTNNPTQTPTQTTTRIPSQTPTRISSQTPTRTPTQTPTRTPTQTPTRTPRPTREPRPYKTPTKTPTPSKTPIPTKTLVPAVDIYDIYENFQEMTSFQFEQYKQSIIGKPVRQSVVVSNVQDDGKITLRGPWSPILFNLSEFCVVVTGAPSEIAIALDSGDTVYLEAVINGIVGDYNYYFNCKNTVVLAYRLIE